MNIVAHLVTRNEADRYLGACLDALADQVDQIAVYDDRSTDATCDVARAHGAVVTVRRADDPSFAEDEGLFRQAAWVWMQAATVPDWVLAIDADEILQARRPLRDILTAAEGALDVPIHECWGFDDAGPGPGGAPLLRVDGGWGMIHGVRVAPGPSEVFEFRDGEATGSVPRAWQAHATSCDDVALLHLGYAAAKDRQIKYDRYRGRVGHSRRHVESILATNPKLVPGRTLLGEVAPG